MNELDKGAGRALKQRRKAAGLYQEALSGAVAIDQSLLSRAKRLGRSPTPLGAFLRICRQARL